MQHHVICPFGTYGLAHCFPFDPYGLAYRPECEYLKPLDGFSPFEVLWNPLDLQLCSVLNISPFAPYGLAHEPEHISRKPLNRFSRFDIMWNCPNLFLCSIMVIWPFDPYRVSRVSECISCKPLDVFSPFEVLWNLLLHNVMVFCPFAPYNLAHEPNNRLIRNCLFLTYRPNKGLFNPWSMGWGVFRFGKPCQ